MTIYLDIDKVPTILKECFLFYSFNIKNYLPTIDNKKQYNFNYTENSSLYNFANFIKENKKYYLNIDWLFDYFNYQFTYWSFIKESKEKNGGIYIIQLHWILGKKALKRFDNKTSKDSYFYHSNFFPTYQIKKENLIEWLEKKECLRVEDFDLEDKKKLEALNTLNKKEENFKEKKYNTIEGFNICLNFTTLFRFDSILCKRCNFKSKCKRILKNNYPKLYQKRISQKIIRNRLENEVNEKDIKK